MLLTVAAVRRATTIGRTTPASPLASPSTTAGGMSGSCIHIVLVLINVAFSPPEGELDFADPTICKSLMCRSLTMTAFWYNLASRTGMDLCRKTPCG
jgi:hypothetical protein